VNPPNPKDLLVEERRARVDAVVAQRTRSIVLVLEDLEDPHNIAAVLRTCEGLGLQEVHAITRNHSFHPSPKITMGAEKWLDLRLHRDVSSCLSALRDRGYLLCATDLGEGAGSLLDLPPDRPLAIVFGTEKTGITSEAAAQCDLRFKIPMLGFTQSLNISVAAAICISHLVFRRLSRGLPTDMPAEEQAGLQERFYALSVKQRHRLFPEIGARPSGSHSENSARVPPSVRKRTDP
jgi:tRNA (guanosine-2'-O-)-methyltransferase